MSVPSCSPAEGAHHGLVAAPQLHAALEHPQLHPACTAPAECAMPKLVALKQRREAGRNICATEVK